MVAMKIRINGDEHDVPDGWTVADLLAARSLSSPRVAVERNGRVVPRAAHAATRLEDADSVEIVSFLGGG
jgi:sulfur carrier protein